MQPRLTLNSIHLHRREVLGLLLGLAAGNSIAQEKPIRLLVGWPPGGQIDLVARLVAEGLRLELGRTVVVENRPGAGGILAAQAVKAAPTDGSVLSLMISHTTTMVPLTTLNPGFDPIKDFSFVASVATSPCFLIINPAVVGADVSDIAAFVKWAKAHPDHVDVGVPAPGSSPEFTVHAMAQAFDIKAQAVPYRGESLMIQDLLGKNLAAGISGIASAAQYVSTGKLKAILVDGVARLPSFPLVPTYSEVGVNGLEAPNFLGVLGPAGMPNDLVAKINAAINKTVASSAFKERTSELGIVTLSGAPADMKRLTLASQNSNAALVKAASFKPK